MGWVRYITPGAGWMERETDGERGGGGLGMFHVACALGAQVFIRFYKSSEVVESRLRNTLDHRTFSPIRGIFSSRLEDEPDQGHARALAIAAGAHLVSAPVHEACSLHRPVTWNTVVLNLRRLAG